MATLLLVGTDKGGFLLRSEDGVRWTLDEPIFKGWKVTSAARTADGEYFLGTASFVYGAAIQRSRDLREFEQVVDTPSYSEESGRKLNQIWKLHVTGKTYYAGVDEAGVFRSDDGGTTWSSLPGLNEHGTREKWFPGAGGLCAHALLVHPEEPERVYCGISAVGVFRTDDGGRSWTPKNDGVEIIIEDEDAKDIGFCVHGLAQDPDDPRRIWRREHTGMFRTEDAGEKWERIENGLPSRFGFPIEIDPHDKSLYVVPLESDEYRTPSGGQLTVYRSRDAGDSWEPLTAGLPRDFFAGTLRAALAVDPARPGGVYFGTTAGTVHASADGGDHWQALPVTLPRVLCVEAFEA